ECVGRGDPVEPSPSDHSGSPADVAASSVAETWPAGRSAERRLGQPGADLVAHGGDRQGGLAEFVTQALAQGTSPTPVHDVVDDHQRRSGDEHETGCEELDLEGE